MFEFIEHLFDPSKVFQMSSLNWTLFSQTSTISTLTRVALFDTFLEIVFPKCVFYNDYDFKESIPIDRQVFIHPFDRVLGLVTLQLPYIFHPNVFNLKYIGLTWDQGDSLPICLKRLCSKPQLNPIRKSKFIHLPMKVAETGY
jgi:hypothetical protein